MRERVAQRLIRHLRSRRQTVLVARLADQREHFAARFFVNRVIVVYLSVDYYALFVFN